jgi:hypothetical protein
VGDYLVFGSENAESDRLLHDCYVNSAKIVASKPILVGRWGTGKSAILLHHGQTLDEKLVSFNRKHRLIWYFTEGSLDLAELKNLQDQSASNHHVFLKSLEAIWKAEILRVVSSQLSILRKYYGNMEGEHWNHVSSVHPKGGFLEPLWRSIPDVLSILRGGAGSSSDPATTIKGRIEVFFNDRLYNAVQECLADIDSHELQPLVVIEPIDSPQSPLEGSSGLARSLITALLNVYRNSFEPSIDQRIIVRMSIPWHRYDVDELEYPQKLQQYTGRVFWKVHDLREFINKRIEWEFIRVHRPFSKKGDLDAWNVLFGEYIDNKHCCDRIKESTFLYVLRHTHHRARDLLRVSRMAIEYSSSKYGNPIDAVLKKSGSPMVSSNALRAAVRDYCRNTVDIRVAEGGRRFPNLRSCVEQLFGMKVPFTSADLGKRIKNMQDTYCGAANVSEAMVRLWSAGIIGLEIYSNDNDKMNSLKERLGSGLRFYKVNQQVKYRRWYIFEYNARRENFRAMIQGYSSEDGVTVNLILHPMTFEYLTPVVAQDCPKGA